MTIRHDGTYVSQPIPFEEWHAGAKMKGHSVHYWRFYANGTYASCSRETDYSLDFYAFTEALSDEERSAAASGRGGQAACGQRLVQVGKYDHATNGVHCTFGPDYISGITFDWELIFNESGLEWVVPNSNNIDLVFRPAVDHAK